MNHSKRNKKTKDNRKNYRIPEELLSKMPGESYSEKISHITLKFSKKKREELVSSNTLYEIYGRKEKKHTSIRMIDDEVAEIERLHEMYGISCTKVVIILATASLYSENELKKLIKQENKKG